MLHSTTSSSPLFPIRPSKSERDRKRNASSVPPVCTMPDTVKSRLKPLPVLSVPVMVKLLPGRRPMRSATSCPIRTDPLPAGHVPETNQYGLVFFTSSRSVPAAINGCSLILIVS